MTWGNVALWIAASAGRVSLVDQRLAQPGELLFVGRGHGLRAVALGTMEFVAPLVQNVRLLFGGACGRRRVAARFRVRGIGWRCLRFIPPCCVAGSR